MSRSMLLRISACSRWRSSGPPAIGAAGAILTMRRVSAGNEAIPSTVSELLDDPFRSLAGELRRAGGYAKAPAPYSEFRWADFLRRRIERPPWKTISIRA